METWILAAVAAVIVVAVGAFLWSLHRKGVANDQLFAQLQLKASDLSGETLAKVAALIQAEIGDKLPAGIQAELAKAATVTTLKAAYFDAADFFMDMGRLPVGFVSPVTLDGKVQRAGTGETLAYYTQPTSGNVTTVKTP